MRKCNRAESQIASIFGSYAAEKSSHNSFKAQYADLGCQQENATEERINEKS